MQLPKHVPLPPFTQLSVHAGLFTSPHVSAHVEPLSHVMVQPPSGHVSKQLELRSQSEVQLPFGQLYPHVAMRSQSRAQLFIPHVAEQLAPRHSAFSHPLSPHWKSHFLDASHVHVGIHAICSGTSPDELLEVAEPPPEPLVDVDVWPDEPPEPPVSSDLPPAPPELFDAVGGVYVHEKRSEIATTRATK